MGRILLKLSLQIEDCAKDGVKELVARIHRDNEEISQSNHSKFNAMQSTMVKNSCSPSLAQSSIAERSINAFTVVLISLKLC